MSANVSLLVHVTDFGLLYKLCVVLVHVVSEWTDIYFNNTENAAYHLVKYVVVQHAHILPYQYFD